MAVHARLKKEFTEDKNWHNLMTWLYYVYKFKDSYSTCVVVSGVQTIWKLTLLPHLWATYKSVGEPTWLHAWSSSKAPVNNQIKIIISAAAWQTNKVTVRPAKTQIKPGHMPSLIRAFNVRSIGSYRPKVSSCGQRRLWSDWADAQAHLSLRWAHVILLVFSYCGLFGSFAMNIWT